MKIKPMFAWYDMWVGLFVDRIKNRWYIFPVPMLGLMIDFNERREYKHGSRYALWRWKDIFWKGILYLRRLIICQAPIGSIMLHAFHSKDQQRHAHDHPVGMLCLVLKGGYLELREDENGNITTHERRPWRFNFIKPTTRHRIIAIYGGDKAYTLCFAGPRVRDWGFWVDGEWVQWEKYHERYEGSTSSAINSNRNP